jgi:hypothetical protein
MMIYSKRRAHHALSGCRPIIWMTVSTQHIIINDRTRICLYDMGWI